MYCDVVYSLVWAVYTCVHMHIYTTQAPALSLCLSDDCGLIAPLSVNYNTEVYRLGLQVGRPVQ